MYFVKDPRRYVDEILTRRHIKSVPATISLQEGGYELYQ